MILKDILIKSKGKITYDDITHIDTSKDISKSIEELKEDLLQIEYKDHVLIDLGWHPSFNINGSFQLQIIKNNDWLKPIHKSTSDNWEKLLKNLEEVILECNEKYSP